MKKLRIATKQCVYVLNSFRRNCDEDGKPDGIGNVLNVFKKFESISKKYNVEIDANQLIDCYYSFHNKLLEPTILQYKMLYDTIIKCQIIKYKE